MSNSVKSPFSVFSKRILVRHDVNATSSERANGKDLLAFVYMEDVVEDDNDFTYVAEYELKNVKRFKKTVVPA